MLTILIACGHIISRELLLRSLSDPTLPCSVLLCADIYAAISICGQQQPDIVLLDGSCDPLAAIEATKKIKTCATTNVIAFSCQADADFAQHMMAAGALGYLCSSTSSQLILTAVKEVANDKHYNCIDKNQLPLPTPDPALPFLQSIASFGKNTRDKMRAATEIHWHEILRFTN